MTNETLCSIKRQDKLYHALHSTPVGTDFHVSPSLEFSSYQGAVSIRKMVLPGMAIPMLKIRRPNGRLIFNMEITLRR